MKKSLISAIKKLLAKLGAEEVEGNNLVEVIDNGADAIEGGGSNAPLICTETNGTLDKTMGEIQTAFLSSRIVYVNNTLVINLHPVHYGKNEYIGSIAIGIIDERVSDFRQYFVTAETEEAALATYPTRPT